jgi:hypothetical protein
MDDYRDIVAAGFAVLCAALMLVAWLLFTSDKRELGNSDPRIERPVATPLSISGLKTNCGCGFRWKDLF